MPDGKARPLLTTMDRCIRHHLARAAAAFGGEDHVRTALALKVADQAAVFSKLYTERPSTCTRRSTPHSSCPAKPRTSTTCSETCLIMPANGRKQVLVTATQRDRRVGLAIDDDGPGLSVEQAAEVMSPGWQLDEISPGYGFGLPSTRELVELYGGSLALAQSDLGGVRATLDLPKALQDGYW